MTVNRESQPDRFWTLLKDTRARKDMRCDNPYQLLHVSLKMADDALGCI